MSSSPVLAQLRTSWTVEDGGSVVRLHGGIDATAARDLAAIGDVADVAPSAVVVDLSDVQYIDVIGLDLLEDLAERATVRLRHPSNAVCWVLARTAGVVDWPALRRQL